jgi:hypothetical protein
MAIEFKSEFGVDGKREIEGTWVNYSGDTEFLIARSRNKNFSRMFARKWAKNKSLLDGVKPTDTDAKLDVADAKADQIMVECYSETILLGWKGVNYNGKPFEYSVENAAMLLTDKEFRKYVEEQSSDIGNFKTAEAAADEKK